jgi:uncharacterized membrane protein
MSMGSALLIFSVVTFGHRMHERYFFPALPLLLMAGVFATRNGEGSGTGVLRADAQPPARKKSVQIKPERAQNIIYLLYAFISLSGFLNSLFVFSAFYTHTSSDFYGDNWIYVISIMNVAAAILLWIAVFNGVAIKGLPGKIIKSRNDAVKKVKRTASAIFAIGTVLIGMNSQISESYATDRIVAMSGAAAVSGQQIEILNPGFEEDAHGIIADGGPQGWGLYDYRAQQAGEPDVSKIYIDNETSRSGAASFRIESISQNDVRLYQLIDVEPDSLYRISCWAKTDSVDSGGVGANVSVLGVFASSESLKGTNTEFKLLELYGRTGLEQNDLWLAVGLGGYSNECFGTAWFDDVSLEKIDFAPQGADIQNFFSGVSKSSDESARPSETSVGARIILMLTVMMVLAAIVVIDRKSVV